MAAVRRPELSGFSAAPWRVTRIRVTSGGVRITDITVVLHERRAVSSASLRSRPPGPARRAARSTTDEGIEGNAFLSSRDPVRRRSPTRSSRIVKPWLLGTDPLDIGRHWRRMENLVPLPVAARRRHASTSRCGTSRARPRACRCTGCSAPAATAFPPTSPPPTTTRRRPTPTRRVYWQEQGWKGYKLHPPRAPWLPPGDSPPVGVDIEACAAVRDAVGDGMTLMLDSSWSLLLHRGAAGRPGDPGPRLPLVRGPVPRPRHPQLRPPRQAPEHPAARHRDQPGRPRRAAAVDHQRARPTSCAATSSSRAASPA